MKRECDRLFSLTVRVKACGCARCGRFRGLGPDALDCAHVFGRSHQGTRWHPDAALGLCRACHDELRSASFTKPSRMEDFYVARYGRDRFELLKLLARTKTRFFPDMLDMLRSRAAALGIPVTPIPSARFRIESSLAVPLAGATRQHRTRVQINRRDF